jgi:CheY-like chemotaxis protein
VRAIILANQISDDLVRSIRDRFRRVPTVRCLLHTTDRAGQQLGVAAFLSKPVTSATVLQALHRLRLHPRRVLVVDDDPDMARLIGRMIRSRHHHCRVHLAAGATEGLEIARQFAGFRRIDAVFLDLLMPEVDGHAFIQTWNADATLRSVPIVVISAASEEDHDRMVAESLEICREGGLPVSELLALVQGSLDRLAAPADDGCPS